MSNDPLMGLDTTELVKPAQKEQLELKWRDVPPPRAMRRGYVTRTKAYAYVPEEPKPVPPVEKTVNEGGGISTRTPVPPAYAIPKKSWVQRLLDYILL